MTTPQTHMIRMRTVRILLQVVLPLAIFAIFAMNLELSRIRLSALDFRYAAPALATLALSYFIRGKKWGQGVI